MTSTPPNWFIDIRPFKSSEHLSLDLTRHLPRRAAVGPVAVITDRPGVLLSVIRKRWSYVIREVQRQYSSTLQASKKEGLKRELVRLSSYQFAVAAKRSAATNILFAQPDQLTAGDHFDTLYLTIPLPHQQLLPLTQYLNPCGFLVSYVGWPEISL